MDLLVVSEFSTSRVLIERCDKPILQLGYFISNLEQHTLDENKVDSAAVTVRTRLASIRHVRRVW